VTIAVLDVGKTNAKALILDEAGAVVEFRARPCAVLPGPPYPHLDLEGIWAWAVAALAELAGRHRIDAIVPIAHGAAAVLMVGEAAALPALDYEHPGPDARAAALAAELDPYARTFSPVLPLGLNLAAQIDWQERTFPQAFAAVTDILPLPQYWAWRLSGVKATEVTSLGAHSHLWFPAERRFSDLALRRGWPFPRLRSAWESLGPVRPELGRALGLPSDCRVLVGIHDSNASYLPHLLARPAPFTVLSTGTWVIAMAAGAPLARLDAGADMLANVDARGDPVPTAKFMGGRELELVAGAEAVRAAAAPADVAAIVAAGVMALPAFVPGSGPCLGRTGRIVGDPGPEPGRRAALAALYGALVVELMLERLGARGPLIVEGSFHANTAFYSLLAGLRPAQPLHPTDDPSGTATGAWLLARWSEARPLAAALGPATAPLHVPGLGAYRDRWREEALG
jgi:sugar (pentulose or hexulose) kinase